MTTFDVYGMCNPLFDLQSEVTDQTLAKLGYAKGSTSLVSSEEQRNIVAGVYDTLINAESGGSGANSMIMVALLGGSACYTGCVGTDDHANMYRENLTNKGVKANLGVVDGATGICAVLVTPDSERTMCTFLGAAVELSVDHIHWDDLRKSKYLYITGYLWDTDSQKEAVLTAMREAAKANVQVALSLSDSFCVNRHKEDFLNLVQNHVDVLFGNESEATALTGETDPVSAIKVLAQHVKVVSITLGGNGSLIYADGQIHEVESFKVNAVDTTGAGDSYAGAVLHGLAKGWPIEKTGRVASYVSSQVVSQFGPRLAALDLSPLGY